MGIFDSLGGLVGLGGGQGQFYQANPLQSKASDAINSNIANLNDPKINNIIAQYSQGGMSLQDALSGLSGATGNTASAYGQLATAPVAGSMLAAQQVQNSPITGGLFGQGGQLSQAEGQATNLANRGFSLQPEDYEAYGQASGNIARQFGTQEQGLAQSLSNRGFGGASSGVAGQQFSGLNGNKNEQLGQMQMQIAQNRMQMNQQRLNDTRNYVTQLGQQGQNAENSQFQQNLSGVQNQQNMLSSAAGQDINKYAAQNQAGEASAQSQQAAQKASLTDAIGKGVYGGVEKQVGGAVSGDSGTNILNSLGGLMGSSGGGAGKMAMMA